MNIAVFSVVHPNSEPYFHEFIGSLSRQTDKDFTLFLINDGIKKIEELLHGHHFSVCIRNESGTPASLRRFGIEWVRSEGADAIIFADSDDCFSENRIETSKEILSYNDLVINELVLFGGRIQKPFPILKNRLADGEVLTKESIAKSNCMGFSNTAMKADKIPKKLKYIQDDIIAFDWAFFSMCLNEDNEAIFTDRITTYYRQYENNIASPQTFTKEQVIRGVKVKRDHYRFLAHFYDKYADMAEEFNILLEKLAKDSILTEKYCEEVKNRSPQSPLWWEPIKTLEELGL